MWGLLKQDFFFTNRIPLSHLTTSALKGSLCTASIGRASRYSATSRKMMMMTMQRSAAQSTPRSQILYIYADN